MLKKLLIMLGCFLVFGVLIFGACAVASPKSVALPTVITEETPCPVAGCTQPDSGCHAGETSPVIDGSFSMLCPKVDGCSDTTCHAGDRLTTLNSQPNDASLNLWILAPVILTVGLIVLVRRIR